ncbi:MAG: integron integrase, partial [Gemmatimonadaceae bacterium]
MPPQHPAIRLDDRPLTLIGQLRRSLRLRRYSPRTEEAYVAWTRRFVRFHGMRHPSGLEPADVRTFLSDLAIERGVSASTQNQALSALRFLYLDVLRMPLPWLEGLTRAKRPKRLPVVLTRGEVEQVIVGLSATSRLLAILMYGSGLRLMEAVSLRVQDVDIATRSITVRSGTGAKDRITVLPERLVQPLRDHIDAVERTHRSDLREPAFGVVLPDALARKNPSAARSLGWYWLFPATRTYVDRQAGVRRRHHVHETVVQRAVRFAARAAGSSKRVTCHSFRHNADCRIMPRPSWSVRVDCPCEGGIISVPSPDLRSDRRGTC